MDLIAGQSTDFITDTIKEIQKFPMMSPGEMIKLLRKQRRLSQIELAALTGITQANISALEKNRIQLGKERSIALAEALNVHPALILFADYRVF